MPYAHLHFSCSEKCRKIILVGYVLHLVHFLNGALRVKLICNIELLSTNCTSTLNKEIIFRYSTTSMMESNTLQKIPFCGVYVFTPTLIRLFRAYLDQSMFDRKIKTKHHGVPNRPPYNHIHLNDLF